MSVSAGVVLDNRRVDGNGRGRTTFWVLRSQARKARNRLRRQAEELAAARELGISVEALRAKRVREAEEIRKNPPQNYSSFTGGRYWYSPW